MWQKHRMDRHSPKRASLALAITLAASALLAFARPGLAQEATDAVAGSVPAAADEIADIFSKVGDQLYDECIFELSDEQVEVQAALIQSYIQQGAESAMARKLAAAQIQPPKLSEKCEQVRKSPPPPPSAPALDWTTTTLPIPKKPVVEAAPKPARPAGPAPVITLANKKVLPQWDCADGVDFVTIHIKGYERKLTGGEICNPFEDVVHEVPPSVPSFRLGYTIKTGRLFIISDAPQINGQTVVWGLSGRDICRNNPDPDCFAAKAIGPLPPGEYTFASERGQRVSWGPRTKRHVAGIYLRKLWNRDLFSPQHTAAILARGNIAIHMRLKGEMSEACIGLEPKGWAYVASLIKEGRATGLNVYIDEPHPQIAEAPPVIVASSFSLTSLFK
ncbi:MAG: DUF2778 domain-containing protein [Hyphomicrobium zavarzinii]|nr:DUF2778 domain-containing protein [Hyphomicrobium zavarzinii]